VRALLLLALAAPLFAQAPPEQCANILVTGDGWTADMRGEFDAFADQVESQLFEDEPYKRMKQFFKITRVFKESKEAGCTTHDCVIPDIPGYEERYAALNPQKVTYTRELAATLKLPALANQTVLVFPGPVLGPKVGKPGVDNPLKRDTAFGLEYNVRDEAPLRGYAWDDSLEVQNASLSCSDDNFTKKIKPFADENNVRPDVALILTPEKQLSSAVTNFKCKISDRDFAIVMMTRGGIGDMHKLADLMSHELGHAFYSLADEYSNDHEDCGEQGLLTQLAMWQYPNIALDPKNPPWKHLLDLGIIKNDPLPGGLMSCPTQVYHPTPSCKMSSNEPPFCPACMERVAHAHIERAKLITSVAPTPQHMVGANDMHLTFTVHTCAKDTDAACTPRYLDYWELDGQKLAGTHRVDASGYTYEIVIDHPANGTHRLRFAIGDGQLMCDAKPDFDRTGGTKAMPWDTTDWWMWIVPSRVLDPLGMHLLFKRKSWD